MAEMIDINHIYHLDETMLMMEIYFYFEIHMLFLLFHQIYSNIYFFNTLGITNNDGYVLHVL